MMRRLASKLGAIAIACTISLAAQAVAESEANIEIPAGELISALKSLATQLDIELVYQPEQLRNVHTEGVQGTYSPQQAIAILLRGTALEVHTDTSGAMVIAPTTTGKQKVEDPAQSQKRIELEEIVVTGSHIQGTAPAGQQLIVIDRLRIEQEGYRDAAEVVKSLTQNFDGGVNSTSTNGASGAGFPANRGANVNQGSDVAINLRGLGASSTLVLLDGQRLAPGGRSGLFTGVSSIPLAAIERVEVLADGASAIYGSDAVGGVVNYVLRKDYEGVETRFGASLPTRGGGSSINGTLTAGTNWSTGNVLLSYGYESSDALRMADRDFSASFDQRARGGSDFRVPLYGNPGTLTSLANGRTYAIPAGQNGTNLNPADFVAGTSNTLDQPQYGLNLTPDQDAHRLFGAVSQDLTADIQVFARALYSVRTTSAAPIFTALVTVPATNPFYFDPSGGRSGVRVNYVFEGLGDQTARNRTVSSVAGITARLFDDWTLKMSGGYARQTLDLTLPRINTTALNAAAASRDPAAAFNPFGDGPITSPQFLANVVGVNNIFAAADITSADAVLGGSLFGWPGGQVKFAVGGSFRRENQSSGQVISNDTGVAPSDSRRDVKAAFAELAIPIVGPENARPGIRGLSLSLAERHEHYSDFGNASSPKIGLSWAPIDGVALRGNWSRSFRAPDLSTLDSSGNSVSLQSVPNPTVPGGSSQVLFTAGGNPGLRPERAKIVATGLDLEPRAIPRLRFSATYFKIDYDERLTTPLSGVSLTRAIVDPLFASTVNANPTAAQIAAFCANAPIQPVNCASLPVTFLVDNRQSNLSVLKTSGLDGSLSYSMKIGNGTLNGALQATHVIDYAYTLGPATPITSFKNQVGQVLDWKFRGALGWSTPQTSSSFTVNYAPAYSDVTLATAPRPIDSFTTVDLHFTYRPADNGWLLRDTSLNLTIQNLLDRDPPFVNTALGYDALNGGSPFGRTAVISLRKGF